MEEHKRKFEEGAVTNFAHIFANDMKGRTKLLKGDQLIQFFIDMIEAYDDSSNMLSVIVQKAEKAFEKGNV